MDDNQLWQQLKSGNRTALDMIYRRHVDALYRYGSKFSRDSGLVEDAIHDVFVDLWKNRKGLSPTDSILKYLLVSIRRRVIRLIQKQAKRQYGTQLQDSLQFHVDITVDEGLIRKETEHAQRAKVKTAIGKLSPRQKEALYLKYFQDLDYEDICQIMGLSYQSARNLIAQALKNMRKYLPVICLIFLF